MSRRCLLPLAPLMLVLALPFALIVRPAGAGTLHHAAKKDVKAQISDLEQQWRAATLGGDVGAMDGLLSDDYVGISWTGQVHTKTSQLDRLRTRSLTITRMDVSDVKIKVVQSVAIVTCRAEIDGMNAGNEMKGTFLYTRIYQRQTNALWKITNFEATRVPPPGERSGRRRPPPAQ